VALTGIVFCVAGSVPHYGNTNIYTRSRTLPYVHIDIFCVLSRLTGVLFCIAVVAIVVVGGTSPRSTFEHPFLLMLAVAADGVVVTAGIWIMKRYIRVGGTFH